VRFYFLFCHGTHALVRGCMLIPEGSGRSIKTKWGAIISLAGSSQFQIKKGGERVMDGYHEPPLNWNKEKQVRFRFLLHNEIEMQVLQLLISKISWTLNHPNRSADPNLFWHLLPLTAILSVLNNASLIKVWTNFRRNKVATSHFGQVTSEEQRGLPIAH